MTVSLWADLERRLSSEASAEHGKWKTERAKYQQGIMDSINDPNIKEVVVISSAQIGKTEILLNIIGYHIDHDPAPILVVQPTLEMAQAFSKDRLAPMLRDTPPLQNKVKDPRSRDSGNTTTHKIFQGGHITMVGANSSSGLASRPIRIVLADEVDRYPTSAGGASGEGDPIQLAKKRTSTFWNRKIVMVSTPTNKNASRIESAYEESDQRKYYVRCKDCNEQQTLTWKNVHWQKDNPLSAVYTCEYCGSAWNDVDRFKAIKEGKWIATEPFKGVAGYHLNGLYSSWINLSDAVTEFLSAKRLPETLRAWTNTFLGETWEDQGERVDDIKISSRREFWAKVPKGVVLLTAGVDVQDDRLEVEVVGWGRDEETWSLDYKVIHGDPSAPQLWADLDELLETQYDHELGGTITIRSTCVDSGGHYTQAVYTYCKARQHKRIFAIKGVGGEGKALVGKKSTNNVAKCPLFMVGVDTAKEIIYSRLKIEEEGAGYMHFPEDRDDEYFASLTAEKIVTRYRKGFSRREWVKTRRRNEALDCRVYAFVAFAILNTNINSVANRFVSSKENIQNPKPEIPNPIVHRPLVRRPKGNWATDWKNF